MNAPESDPLAQRVIAIIAANQFLPAEEVRSDSRFDTLGIESIDAINLLFALEDAFEVELPEEVEGFETVGDVIDALRQHLAEKALRDTA